MLKISKNNFYTGQTSPLFSVRLASKIRDFHKKIENYKPTPLVSLPNLAAKLGVKAIYVKDESHRFGLNAFKVLGGSYALGCLLAEHLQVDINEIDLKTVAAKLDKPLVFATATAGNHGIGIAWAAREMGQKAFIYMPKGSSAVSVERVKKLGAECIVTDLNYDDTVRLVSELADKNGWFLVQDTAWTGYEKIPNWIAQGYMTMADEAAEQLLSMDCTHYASNADHEDDTNNTDKVVTTGSSNNLDDMNGLESKNHANSTAFTHLFLQAGVGSMAGSVLGYFADRFGPDNFTTIIAEPITADCIYKSGTSDTGDAISVGGDLKTIMAGLACGVPNPVTWQILRDCSNYLAAVDDSVTATGMRVLGNPIANDTRVISGGSGAVTLGLLYRLCAGSYSGASDNADDVDNGIDAVGYSDIEFCGDANGSVSADISIREQLGLNQDSVIMIFSTEGDTNPDLYRDVVWDGFLSLTDKQRQ